MPHVFISYVRENQDLVDRLVSDLQRFEVDVWLDRERIKPGERWQDTIREAIRNGLFFVACFSIESSQRDRTYLNEELTIAIEELRLRTASKSWFIPVILSGQVPNRSIGAGETLRDLQWVDLSADWSGGIRRIVSVVKPEILDERALVAQTKNQSQESKLRAIRSLGELSAPGSEVQRTLIDLLRDSENSTVQAAQDALINLGMHVVPSVALALRDENPKLRERIVTILGEIGGHETLNLLIERHPKESGQVKVELIRVLRKFDDPRVDAIYMTSLKDDDNNVRAMTAAVLGERNGVHAVPGLIDALTDDSIAVRWFAAQSLGLLGDRRATPALIAAIRTETWDDPETAIEALGKLAVPEAIPHLRDVVCGHKFGWIRIAALQALSRIGGSAATDAILEGSGDHFYEVREVAAKLLGESADPKVIPALDRLKHDAIETVRSAAIEALHKLVTKRDL